MLLLMDAAAAPKIPPVDWFEAAAPPKGVGAGAVEDGTPKAELAFVAVAPVVDPPNTDEPVPNTPPPPLADVVTVDAPNAGGFAAAEAIPKAGGAALPPAAIAPNDGVAVPLPAELPPKLGTLLLVPNTFAGAAFDEAPKPKVAFAPLGCCAVEVGVVVAPNENELAAEVEF